MVVESRHACEPVKTAVGETPLVQWNRNFIHTSVTLKTAVSILDLVNVIYLKIMIQFVSITQYHSAELVDCFDYSVCSATCGSGTQTCQRTCQNGTFGDTGCPIDQEFKTRTCNSQECRKYSLFNNSNPLSYPTIFYSAQIVDCHEYTECSASCGSGTQTCTRTCDNGNFGDAGCPSNDHYNTRICNEQHCSMYL